MRPGSKVILKTEKYEDDKYNPRELVGIVLDTKPRFSPVEVRWSNGLKNSYFSNELEEVD